MCGTKSPPQNSHAQRGFSMLETVIAGALLSVGVIGTMGLQITAIKTNRFGIKAVQALTLAESQVATLRSLPFADTRLADANTSNNPASVSAAFPEIPSNVADPTSYADGYDATPLDEIGQARSGATYANGDGFQRVWMIYSEQRNTQITGPSAIRINVVVRWRDDAVGQFRSVTVNDLRAVQR